MDSHKKIKICYVVSVDIMARFILLNQLIFLKKEGFDVYLICSPGKWTKEIQEEGIKVENIRFKRRIDPFSDAIALIKLFLYFKKEKFDIVHTHTPKISLLGQVAAKLAGVPIIVNTIHGFYFQKTDSWKRRTLFMSVEKIAAKCSNLIFFVNREDMKTAIEEKICSPRFIKYFGGGVDMERFNPERFSEEFIKGKKQQLGVPENNRVIGILARLVKEKGYEDLFCAFEKILKNFPHTTLVVIGPLELEKKDFIDPAIVKDYHIEKNVLFLGERIDVDEIYAAMDMFVLPSYREGLGISLLEASAMKKPVVATDIRGCREAVEDGAGGILIPRGDVEALKEAVLYVMTHQTEAKKMGENGRLKVKEEFNEKIVFDRIKREYSRLIEEKIA